MIKVMLNVSEHLHRVENMIAGSKNLMLDVQIYIEIFRHFSPPRNNFCEILMNEQM